MIQQIQNKFKQIEQARSESQGEIRLLKEQRGKKKKHFDLLNEQYTIQEKVLDILKKYSKAKEDLLKTKVDEIITKGLNVMLSDENLRSKLRFDIKRGQAVVEPKLITQFNEKEIETNPASGDSGGLANVVGFLYQLLMLSLYKPKVRQVLFADEPFKNLSEEYLEAAGEFMRVLAERLGIQIILITHKTQFKSVADVHYRFSKENQITQIEKIKG
jgi:DNA repair exonuclease SbcCD ATPase subunit